MRGAVNYVCSTPVPLPSVCRYSMDNTLIVLTQFNEESVG